MKIVYSIALFLAFQSFLSCSDREELQQNEMIEVVFKTNKVVTTKTEVKDDLSVFAFRQTDKGSFSHLEREDNTVWETDGDGSITKKIILPIGTYRFLMVSGLSSAPTTDRIIFEKGEKSVGGYDGDYYFSYPSERDDTGGLLLKNSPTELFVDANDLEPDLKFDPNGTEYALLEGNKFSISRKITRLQGRMDLIVRRGEKISGESPADVTYEPIKEGVGNEDAMKNALKRIESIEVTLINSSSRCHVDGLTFSTPVKRFFKISSGDFCSFLSKDFVEELNGVKKEDYDDLDNSAYRKGELLFPAPSVGDEGDVEDVRLEFCINYELPLPAKKVEQVVKIERNRVALVKLWLLSEGIGVDVTVDSSDLIFGDGDTQGDDGFWN